MLDDMQYTTAIPEIFSKSRYKSHQNPSSRTFKKKTNLS